MQLVVLVLADLGFRNGIAKIVGDTIVANVRNLANVQIYPCQDVNELLFNLRRSFFAP